MPQYFVDDDEYGDPDPFPAPIPTPIPRPEGGDASTGQGPRVPVPPPGPDDVQTQGRRGGGGGDQGFPGQGGPIIRVPGAPIFTPPVFNRPTMEDAYNEPGYQFRVNAGNQALERSAAARGVLRTGGTLKDLVEYGQNFAAQEYGQVFNRALSSYDRQYQGARDAFAPQMARYQAQVNAEQARALAGYQREWDAYTFARRGGGGGGQNYYEPPPNPDTWVPGGDAGTGAGDATRYNNGIGRWFDDPFAMEY